MSKRIWDHFADQFGVSNILPIALAREGIETTLPDGMLGKVPSRYNTHGHIVGFHKWQEGRAKASDVNAWSTDSRYGFGVLLGQPLPAGGVAICIDVDTESEDHQRDVYGAISVALGVPAIPMRVRTNSNRRAYVLCVETTDQLTKRVLTLRKAVKAEGIKGEAVEILGYGQQFAAYGVHPSGVDLEWLDAPADSLTADECLPNMGQGGQRLSLEAFNALIDAIRQALPIINDATKSARNRSAKNGNGANVADPVAIFLDENDWTIGIGKEGERHIRSPFADEYTKDQTDSDTSVTYFLAGTRDYEQGHFVSHHASDAARSDADFIDAIGYVVSQFETLPAVVEQSAGKRPALTQVQGGKQHNRIEATLLNVLAALGAPNWLGHHVAFDEFTGNLSIGGAGAWRPFDDTDYTQIRATLERKGFLPVDKSLCRDAVQMHARQCSIDTGKQWLTAQTWDKVKRVPTFLHDYFGTPNDEYTRAVSVYIWTALAGRLLQPGIKADMMPIFIGAQGCGKSTGVEAIAPARALFTDLSFHDSDADQARKLRGVCVAEFAEMSGLRGRAIEAVKASLTRTHDKWVQKYQEQATQYPRRALFFGTSNDDELLDDPTGARRWLPVAVGKVDVDAIARDCAQLWAEGAVLFAKHGVASQGAYMAALARGVADEYRVSDPFEVDLAEWLITPCDLDGSTPGDAKFISTRDIIKAMQAAGNRIDNDFFGQKRVTKAMISLNWRKARKVVNNCQLRGFRKATTQVD